ncbi:MAG TPA: copper resistance protein B [Rudaea sp.]
MRIRSNVFRALTFAAGLLVRGVAAANDAAPTDPANTMDMPPMQGGAPPADARDPDLSDGQTMSAMPGMADSMNDRARFGKVVFDQLEAGHTSARNGIAFDAQAYYGGDVDKVWFKADGERSDGRLRDTRIEALWSHAQWAFWDTQLGVRRDAGDGPGRTWAAFGVQGLAPYWFDVEAAVYVGDDGRTAARTRVEYDLRLTQKLIVTPEFEANAYGRRDRARRLGSGLSNLEAGLRLRYEITRRFAPYVGFDWNRRVGGTADLARAAGETAFDHAIVAGVRFWF